MSPNPRIPTAVRAFFDADTQKAVRDTVQARDPVASRDEVRAPPFQSTAISSPAKTCYGASTLQDRSAQVSSMMAAEDAVWGGTKARHIPTNPINYASCMSAVWLTIGWCFIRTRTGVTRAASL
ncbi:uncharacterized protein KD926_002238 [Aspergillus affinis]|uniref:uncharacterized protein n=1 Tax=Aspergillus affinis TaxID=1070780 RepID=UPI0022FEB9B3|nr:uncharacterized protein KD926_002238 [Aspergillus affinis]KAI9036150.1 hypothetical protein KD926_002238 [Aspergillus affinis]